VILAMGRLDPQKGFDMLLDAFGRIAGRHPTWDLAIAGDGAQRDALLSQARLLGVDHRTHLLGHVGNVQDWYERADLFVMSSRFEGFPNALLEAMACGCPAVSFDCDTGPRELIDNGVNGTLVPPEKGAAGLAVAIDRLIGDAELRHAFGLSAAQVRQRLALSRIARQWEQLFDVVRFRVRPLTCRSQ
jgi:glycosyltransferase involved in cell wall biosynthesis